MSKFLVYSLPCCLVLSLLAGCGAEQENTGLKPFSPGDAGGSG